MSEVIRFNYLHHNSGDHKKFGSKLFSNPFRMSLDRILQGLKETLIFERYFYPDQVGIKKFKFHRYLKDDYSWYEFESIEYYEDENFKIEELDSSINGFFLDLGHMAF
ncbi:MAG: hypothetical protein GZ094_04800 [Mariniphaga sp.]|nr:hypothetical protein [Mariniphaga sp.]